TYTAPTFSDNCDGTGTVTWVSGPISGASLNVGGSPYTVVYTKTDAAGNAVLTDCSFTVTVQDDTKPTLANCPSNIVLKTSDDGGANCEVTVNYTAPTFSDNCDGTGTATYVSGPTSGTSLNVSGSPYTVVYTKTDAAGNTVLTDCSFTVTVQDDTKPTLANCPSNILLKTSDDGGADCAVTVNYTAPTFSDNCDGTGTATHVSGPTSGASLNVSGSPYTVVYTKTDAAGNAVLTNCSFTVTVQDDTKPTITRTGSSTVEICQYEIYTDAGAMAMDNCGGNITGSIVTNNPVNTSVPDTYTVTYDVMDASNNQAFQVTRTVIVHPVPTASVSGNILVCIGATMTLNGNPTGGSGIFPAHGWVQTGGAGSVSFTNNNDGTADIQGVTAGSVTIEYTVTDAETCTGTAVYYITVVDCNSIVLVNDKQPNDPCSCNNDQSANGAQNGTFSETVSVLPTSNTETWTVVAISRLAGSGGLPTGIAVNDLLTYDVGGFHAITFQHVDDAGYTIIVEGPNLGAGTPGNPAQGNQQFTVSNICQYPVIAFDPSLPANVCLNNTPILLTVSEANSFAGVATFTVNGNPDTQFDPSAPLTPGGPYPVVANFIGTFASNTSTDVNNPAFPGCMTDISDEIGIYDAPTVSCPSPIVLNTSSDDSGDCDAEYLLNHPDIGTICATTLEISFANGAPAPPYLPADGVVTPNGSTTYAFAAGQTIVTYTATGAANNVSACMFTVTVTDDEDPTAICPGPQTVPCATSVPAPNPALVNASDNCGIVLREHWNTTPPYNVQCLNKFQLTRYYRVYDAEGNSATCSQVITVFDDVKPVFSFVPANVTVQCNSVPAVGTPAANDNCIGTVTINYDGQDRANGSCVDSYVLTRQWTATDACGNTQTATQRITVIDTQKPNFTSTPANITVQCDAIPSAVAPIAIDNCDATVAVSYIGQTKTNGACANTYTLTRRWMASDNCNNTRSISQRITVVDNGKPTITVPGNVTIACNAPSPPVGTATATDGCTGNVATVYLGQSTMNATCPGNYQLWRTWKATDVCGNSTAATQTITVVDNVAPVFVSVPNNVTIQCNQAPPALSNPVATDNCGGPASITYLGQVRTDGNCLYNYTLTRTWRATDLCGNSTIKAQVITVQDTQAPTFTNPPANVTVVCAPDFVPPPVTPNATDNCGTPSVTLQQTQSPGDCSTGYTVTRTWTATDQCGNPKVHVQTFTVLPSNFAPPAADRDQQPLKTQHATLKTMQLTPNPTTDRVLIGLGDFAGETVVVSIYSDLGRLIWERNVEVVANLKLPVNLREAGAAAGVYTVVLRSGEYTIAKRLVYSPQD
ncbi:MAG: HYR domain-containing protein, partial [Saprospiraceae bacterium]